MERRNRRWNFFIRPDFLMRLPERIFCKPQIWRALWLCLLLLLSACKLPAPEKNVPTQDFSEAVFTSAALTVEAANILNPSGTPSPARTVPPQQATLTAAWTAGPSPTPVGAVYDGPLPEGDRGEFVDDVTVPDGKTYAPGERFTKTWRLLNTGSTTWTTEYSVIYISGALMEAAPSTPLPNAVAPGETVDVSVELTAPKDAGSYTGYWKLRNAAGQIFGLGSQGGDAFWVLIKVDTSLVANTATPVGNVFNNITLRIDNPDRTTTCPQVFRVTAQFFLDRPAMVAYVLEAGYQEDKPSAGTIKMPPPAVRNLDAGSHTLIFELTFSNTFYGWLKIHFTQPEDLLSEPVEFSLVCQ
jgi:hypothetical protein